MKEKKKCLYCHEMFIPNKKAQKLCSLKCSHLSRRKRVSTVCSWCGEGIEVTVSHYRNYKSHHCSKQHRAFSSATSRGSKVRQVGKEVMNIEWNMDVAYLIGLITTDGTLRKDRKQIRITSSDINYLKSVREIIISITGRTLEIKYELVKFQGKEYDSYSIQFTSYPLYNFCLDIGIAPNKTYIISNLDIPNGFFSPFLRGVIDGDGNINKRSYYNNEQVNIRIYSASQKFLEWINNKCKEIYNVFGGKFYEDKNDLGSKKILTFTRIYDNLIILGEIYKNLNYYYEKRYNQAKYTIDNIYALKEKYKHTYLDGKKIECKKPNCNNLFVPSHYRQKYCTPICRIKV